MKNTPAEKDDFRMHDLESANYSLFGINLETFLSLKSNILTPKLLEVAYK